MNTSARGRRRAREAAGIGEWLQGAATPIKKGADVSIGAGARLDFAAPKGGDISALRQPFLGAPAHLRKALGTRCALNPTAAAPITVDVMARDEVEHQIRRRPNRPRQPATADRKSVV